MINEGARLPVVEDVESLRKTATVEVNSANNRILVKDGGYEVGAVAYGEFPYQGERFSCLYSLSIDPSARGRGYGSILIEGANAVLRERGRMGVLSNEADFGTELYDIATRELVPAADFYRRHGWAPLLVRDDIQWMSYNVPEGKELIAMGAVDHLLR